MIEHSENEQRKRVIEKLTKSEKEILVLISEGQSSAIIADQRKCSTRTVEKHRSNIVKKLNLIGEANTLIRWASSQKDFLKE